MGRKKGFTLRATVNLIVLIAVLTTLLTSALIGYESEKQSLTKLNFQLNEVYSEKIADTVNSLFENMKQSLKVTGEYLSENLSRQDLQEQLVMFQRGHSTYNNVFIVNPAGILIGSTNLDRSIIGTLIQSDGIDEALKLQQPLVSDPYISATGKLVVMVSQPLRDSTGKYLGFIGGSIRLHETSIFQTILETSPHTLNGSYSYVVSSSGFLLFHPDVSRIGENVSKNLVVEKLMNGESGTTLVTNNAGIHMLASYSYIEKAGWGIVSQTPMEVVLSEALDFVLKLLLYMLPILLVFMVVIYWVVGKISEPLAKLAQFSGSLSLRGNVELPLIKTWNKESNELHRAFGLALRHFQYQYEHLAIEATTDPLTGLYNRRTMDHYMNLWIEQKRSFALMVLDLDNFKQVNDNYGHDIGDRVLTFLAKSLQRLSAEQHIICRFGGEEFVILTLDSDVEEAIHEAEGIRKYMHETTSPTGQVVTISIGISHFPSLAQDADQLFRLADEAMYRAKHLGRNRVELAQTNK
jgi:diguanylate cyclase (GGDEF)-like protein